MVLSSAGTHSSLLGEECSRVQTDASAVSIKTLFIVPTDAHYYKFMEMLKQYKIYNICSDMFRFTQETSPESSPVLS